MSWSPMQASQSCIGWDKAYTPRPYTVYGDGPRVVVLDFDTDPALISWLALRDCKITVIPGPASCRRVLDLVPELVIVSGQSRDDDSDLAVETVSQLREDVALFGVGRGFELLVLACGGTLSASPDIHRGGVRVVDLETGRRFTTVQDHRLHANRQSLARTPLTALQVSVDDLTVEAVRCQDGPAAAVHYQPAAGEGPAGSLLERMLRVVVRPGEHRVVNRHAAVGRG